MIPKKIHYCWFSGRPLPAEFQRYIDSWKRLCPQYEIIRWDESNYDIHRCQYMESAYREKRWGFVPDYARFDIIYREGGIYLDTDVELIKPLDALLDNRCYFGFESADKINAGLGFGAEKGDPVIRELRDMYESLSFYKGDGTPDLTPSPQFVSKRLQALGVRLDGSFQRLAALTVYPRDYLGCKDYVTGLLQRSENSVSIHHFSCTWMTRAEKLAEDRRLALCARYGSWLGNRADGVCKRLRRLPSGRSDARRSLGSLPERAREHFLFSPRKDEARLQALEQSPRSALSVPPRRMVLLAPALGTCNLGDEWIERSCLRELSLAAPEPTRVSTHTHPDAEQQEEMRRAELVLAAGSNLLGGDVRHSQWKLPGDYTALSRLCLMGCGWSRYGAPDDFSARFYRRVLNNGFLHSVRDRYTERMLRQCGVRDVVYTGCPTMWRLTQEHCRRIPVEKGDAAVTALTSYQPDPLRDGWQLQTVLSAYETVYFWPQGAQDADYLLSLLTREERKRVVILNRDWHALEALLRERRPDYVGNRLHAGIFALGCGCRSRIVAIDNRAAEIGRDSGLPVVRREELDRALESAVCEPAPISLRLPWENIARWKRQFEERRA